MPRITLSTEIKASKDIVFDLSRSIDLHKISTNQSNEKAIAGKTTGLIELGESVTWRARHFGFYQTLTSKITEFNRPDFFVDEMTDGIFKSFRHEHQFIEANHVTIMTDAFDYVAPLGILGNLANVLFLRAYMTRLLTRRNIVIKEYAESGRYLELPMES